MPLLMALWRKWLQKRMDLAIKNSKTLVDVVSPLAAAERVHTRARRFADAQGR